MIDGLVAGKLYGTPAQKTSKAGKPFTVAKLRTTAADGESNVIAFSDATCTALLAMSDGDSVALAGALTPKVWTDRDGKARPALDMVAHGVLSAYHVTRKRRAMQPSAPAGADDGDGWPGETAYRNP
ncbi:MAG: single-stranded DNA-binding protein [Burkholderiaceae bacterium]|nr:single-stranded DNA-binding protein [Burkholderiaceae bacterium]MDZ4144722.1 single-stranded DNA-binding protein [Burkholderiales bacterium]